MNMIVPNTLGLVVCGGSSSRMGRDKSLLQYYDKPQRYHVYEMLKQFCGEVYISGNQMQSGNIDAGYNILKDDDVYTNIGPMAALLTAFTQFPNKNILLIGCDYPFLTARELEHFSRHCTKENNAVAFYNELEDLYEPLLAWYPSGLFEKLKKMYEAKQFSLQHFLKDNRAIKFYPQNKNSITSIDTWEDFIQACNLTR